MPKAVASTLLCNCIRLNQVDSLPTMRRSLPAIRMYLMLLLLAVFVVVPVAESLACAQEAPASQGDVHALSSDSDLESGKDKSKQSSGADSCGHGHCHHSTASLPAAGHDYLFANGRTLLRNTEHGDVYALRLDGPMRPPRI